MKKLNKYGLTPQQEIFCQEYIKEPIMYKAFIKAYPKAEKWKRNSIDSTASQLLNNPKINQRIEALNAHVESALKNSITLNKRKILDEIIRQYSETAESGASERTNSVALLKLMAQISKLLDNSPQINNNIVVNNQNINQISDFLDL